MPCSNLAVQNIALRRKGQCTFNEINVMCPLYTGSISEWQTVHTNMFKRICIAENSFSSIAFHFVSYLTRKE